MRLSTWPKLVLRESRGARSRLAFFVLCLALGVAAVVAVAGLSAGLREALRGESRRLLAGDLAVVGRRPIPPEVDALLAARPGVGTAEVRELVTTVATVGEGGADGVVDGSAEGGAEGAPRRSQLVELKAVADGYPFYGEVELAPGGVESGRRFADLLGDDGVAVAPDLLRRLGIAIGDRLLVGGLPFTVVAAVEREPDRLEGAFRLGPRVFVSVAGLARTDLERFGSRVVHRRLVRLEEGADAAAAERLAGEIDEALPEGARFEVESWGEGQPELADGIRRVERFLGLVALLSLLVGGVGVAQTVRAWLAARLGSIAVLRCLGMRPREIAGLYLGQSLLLAAAGSGLGGLAGLGLIAAAPRLLGDVLPVAPAIWQPAALARGVGLGMGIALLFTVPPLLAVGRVPPVRVLRRDADPLPPNRWAVAIAGLALVVGLAATASAQADSFLRGLAFTGGLAAATAALAAGAWGVMRLAALAPRERARPWLRHGLAALGRPGAATVGAVVALGLGILVVLGMRLVEVGLGEELAGQLPEDAPTAFLIDIQPDQWPDVRRALEDAGASRIDSVPVVSARLVAVEGETAEERAERAGDDGGRRWALTREQRLTYLEELPEDNEVVAGELWSDPGRPEISVEEEFAGDLGVDVGSRLAFDVQGVPLELVVTSLRRVDWRTFGINFFLVVEPGVLEGAPQTRVAAARLPQGGEAEVRDRLAASHPNVTLFPIRDLLETVAEVLGRLATGVRFLGAFTVLAGVVILGGAVAAGAVRRAREVALLKTLGMTRRQVAALYAVEYGLVGLVAGVVGAVGGSVLAWAVLTRGMEIGWRLRPGELAVAVGVAVALAVVAGLAASWRALAVPPVAALRAAG